jgi:hypothetical protein
MDVLTMICGRSYIEFFVFEVVVVVVVVDDGLSSTK